MATQWLIGTSIASLIMWLKSAEKQIVMPAVVGVHPGDTHKPWIPAPRLRGDKLHGNHGGKFFYSQNTSGWPFILLVIV